MTTLTRLLCAPVTAVVVLAVAIPATSGAAEPKNDVPFQARPIHHPTAVDRIIAQERARRGDPFVFGVSRTEPTVVRIVQRPRGFDWGDAGVGGTATLALVLLVAAGTALRRDKTRQEAHG